MMIGYILPFLRLFSLHDHDTIPLAIIVFRPLFLLPARNQFVLAALRSRVYIHTYIYMCVYVYT